AIRAPPHYVGRSAQLAKRAQPEGGVPARVHCPNRSQRRLRPPPPPLRPPRLPPLKPPSRGGGGGDARATAMASLSIFSSIGSPLEVSSSIAACRLRLSLPWLSTSTALTTISSPTFATSSTLSTLWSVSLEM